MKYAGFWIRFVANFIDGLVLGLPLYIVESFLFKAITGVSSYDYFFYSSMDAGLVDAFPPNYFLYLFSTSILGLIVGILYFGLMTSSTMQGTLGKMIVGVKVIDVAGDRISFGRAVGRYFGYILSNMTFLIGYIMAGMTKEKRALHDYVAGTYVVWK